MKRIVIDVKAKAWHDDGVEIRTKKYLMLQMIDTVIFVIDYITGKSFIDNQAFKYLTNRQAERILQTMGYTSSIGKNENLFKAPVKAVKDLVESHHIEVVKFNPLF